MALPPCSPGVDFLWHLWQQPAITGTAHNRGRRREGKLRICALAANAIVRTQTHPNRVAAALGLGACWIYATSSGGRPTKQIDDADTGRRQDVYVYHLTWLALRGDEHPLPPPAGAQYSHRCHRPNCVNPASLLGNDGRTVSALCCQCCW